jgi:hypothetical protein
VAAQQLGEEAYRSALERVKDQLVGDAIGGIFLLDSFVQKREYRRVIEIVEAFEARFVEDGNTARLKCLAAREIGMLDEARAHCLRAVDLEPSTRSAWSALSLVANESRDVALAIRVFSGMETHLGQVIYPERFSDDSEFEWLSESDEFRQWVDARASTSR